MPSKTSASQVANAKKANVQLEKSLAQSIKKKNAVLAKGPKTLGSTRGSELKKLKNLNKKKLISKKKGERKPPAAASLPFLTYKNAVDVALFYCPGKYLDYKEVCEFINKTFVGTGHDASAASQKSLQKQVEKVLKKGIEEDEENPVRYNQIYASSGSLVLSKSLIFKYKLDPKHRARLTSGANFKPVFPKQFDSSLVKEVLSKKTFAVPLYQKRASTKTKEETHPVKVESTA